jgi:hypothetical protein
MRPGWVPILSTSCCVSADLRGIHYRRFEGSHGNWEQVSKTPDLAAIYERSLPDVRPFANRSGDYDKQVHSSAPNEHRLRRKHRFMPSCPWI